MALSAGELTSREAVGVAMELLWCTGTAGGVAGMAGGVAGTAAGMAGAPAAGPAPRRCRSHRLLYVSCSGVSCSTSQRTYAIGIYGSSTLCNGRIPQCIRHRGSGTLVDRVCNSLLSLLSLVGLLCLDLVVVYAGEWQYF